MLFERLGLIMDSHHIGKEDFFFEVFEEDIKGFERLIS
jgi:hypothetical protein